MEQIPVIYILSSGRSGSTLLDLLLGAHPDVWTLGEAQMLPCELERDSSRCGCGANLRECGFWKSVVERVPLKEGRYPIEFFRGDRGREKVLRWAELPHLIRGRVPAEWRAAVAQYGDVNARYFRAVREEAEQRLSRPVRWIVDASKDPYRLVWLRESGLFQVKVIHLVKDPRAFVYSMVKADLPVPWTRTVRYACRWLVQNALFARLCRVAFGGAEARCLRYEELASRPDEVLTALGAWLGLSFRDGLVAKFRQYENHAISGGRMRWERSQVKLDEKWRWGLPPRHAHVAGVLTWPMARAYGYGR